MLSPPRILLLHPYNVFEQYHYAVPQVALGYLAAALKGRGYTDVHVKDAHLFRWEPADVVRYVTDLRPDVLCLRVWSHQIPTAERYIAEVRQRLPGVHVVLGGPHITVAPEHMRLAKGVDYAVAGEAEESLPRIIDHICGKTVDLDSIPGLVRMADGELRVNPLATHADLDDYAIDWDALELPKYHELNQYTTAYDCGRQRNAFIFTTRGCPYPCTYCAAGITNGKKIRAHSAARVMADIEYLYHRYGVRHFNIMDDNFTFYRDVVLGFCNEFLKRRERLPGITFHNPNGVRVDRLDDEMLALMRECGWRWLHVGIESGARATLQRMRKRLDLDLARENIRKIRAYGIKCWGFFILGYLDETRADMEETIRFAVDSALTAATFSLFSPIPGTAVYREMVRRGLIPPDFISNSYMSVKHQTFASDVDSRELHSLLRSALIRFYSRPDRAFHLLRGMSWSTFADRVVTIFIEPTRRRFRPREERGNLLGSFEHL